jgi:hypothetical protein
LRWSRFFKNCRATEEEDEEQEQEQEEEEEEDSVLPGRFWDSATFHFVPMHPI